MEGILVNLRELRVSNNWRHIKWIWWDQLIAARLLMPDYSPGFEGNGFISIYLWLNHYTDFWCMFSGHSHKALADLCMVVNNKISDKCGGPYELETWQLLTGGLSNCFDINLLVLIRLTPAVAVNNITIYMKMTVPGLPGLNVHCLNQCKQIELTWFSPYIHFLKCALCQKSSKHKKWHFQLINSNWSSPNNNNHNTGMLTTLTWKYLFVCKQMWCNQAKWVGSRT